MRTSKKIEAGQIKTRYPERTRGLVVRQTGAGDKDEQEKQICHRLKKIRKRKGLSREALRKMLMGIATEVKDEEKLQIAVSVLRSIAR